MKTTIAFLLFALILLTGCINSSDDLVLIRSNTSISVNYTTVNNFTFTNNITNNISNNYYVSTATGVGIQNRTARWVNGTYINASGLMYDNQRGIGIGVANPNASLVVGGGVIIGNGISTKGALTNGLLIEGELATQGNVNLSNSLRVISSVARATKVDTLNQSVVTAFQIYHDPSANNVGLGYGSKLEFLGRDNIGQETIYGAIYVNASPTHGNEKGTLVFQTINGGILANKMTITPEGYIGINTYPVSLLDLYTNVPNTFVGARFHNNANNGGSAGTALTIIRNGTAGTNTALDIISTGGNINVGASVKILDTLNSSIVPLVSYYHDLSSGVGVNGVGIEQNFYAPDSIGNGQLYASIKVNVTSVTHGNEYGALTFTTTSGAQPAERLRISGQGFGIGIVNTAYPLEINKSLSGISGWFLGNVSATGYITRTDVYKGSDALSSLKDSSEYVKVDGKIDHKAFGYSYVNYTRTEFDFKANKTIVINEEGVDLVKEIALLKQAVYELKVQLDTEKQKTQALENNLLTLSK